MEHVKSATPGFYATLRLRIQALRQSVAQFLGDGDSDGDGKQKNAIRELDGVRGIACLFVVVFHMFQLASFYGIWQPAFDDVGALMSAAALSGESGVILFFILSGFLLFLPYTKSMLFDSAWPSLPRFYTRRVFRIIPGYYVALCLITIFWAPWYLQQMYWHDLWLFLTFRMDFPPTFQKLDGPFWTLAVEFQFYMLLPLVAWLMRLLVRQGPLNWRLGKLTFCLLLMIAWGFGTRYWGLFLSSTLPLDFWLPHPVAAFLTPYIFGKDGKYFEVFAIGMLVCMFYIYLQHRPSREHRTSHTNLISLVLFGSGLAIFAFLSLWHFWHYYRGKTLHFFDTYKLFWTDTKDLFLPIGYAIAYALCMFALLRGPAWLKRLFQWTLLRWLGLISYSVYMWHYPIIMHFIWNFLPNYQKLGWSQAAQACVYILWLLLTVFPLSILLYHFIEMPGIRLGERLWQKWERRKLPQDVPVIPVHEAPERVPVANRRSSPSINKD